MSHLFENNPAASALGRSVTSPETMAFTSRAGTLTPQSTIVRDAWARGQELAVHGWIYAVGDGLLRDLKICITRRDELASRYEAALAHSPASDVSRAAGGQPQ